jgi:hypothetical protein
MKKKKYSKQPVVGRLVRVVAEKEMGFDAFFFLSSFPFGRRYDLA